MKRSLLIIALLSTAGFIKAQTKTDSTATTNSTDSLMKTLSAPQKGEPVIATFKATRLILSQTTETVKKKELNFLVIHRFGDIGGAAGGGKALWGLDNSSDIYIGFEYGLTDNLNIDFGRSKSEQLIELSLKYNILHQKTDNSVPVAVTLIGKTALKPYHVNTNVFDVYSNRFNYLAQAVIARKFSSALSLQVSPIFVRTNLPYPFLAGNTQNVFALSAAGRLKFSKRMGIVLDYVHPFSNFRDNSVNPKFYDGLGVGIEIETGGHVFTINFTNAEAISEFNYVTNTQSSWSKGQFRLGFTISRIFDFNKKHKSN
ncbi:MULTISPECIES: DUF5777 family beta-barrel protein [unclassified Mucilaginibacter]|uniref:DUF5777 family beta-barrel protein n=1 Tax=unclassified Mucilaginibacter TaxID=2617802 RepID=UPI002AC8E81B|nr:MULTISPECIES: DUF5777 family beta-barrel protein [unclassified Mucilaginibacter]MEB0263107.1 DUF5777 family beta-barrel protein [Mucilaginibacter sp. 10I4]MEB0277757.1 DUF5777 family beta-barrel protein [Mucilaginibacter sp. 10B2]MEB0301921.1 DUF5777 family beta-barrel protein [Mucilaginibacter sp. 5C4]WPX24618.1 DUF5777 family beta-barrel protein [Mucilaginibacter sp. 5C4]